MHNIREISIDTKHIEYFGLMTQLLILLEDFYRTGATTRKNSIVEYLNNDNLAKKIIDLIAYDNKSVFSSWQFIYDQNINNLLSLAYNLSVFNRDFSFLRDAIQCTAEWSKSSHVEISRTNLEYIAAALEGKGSNVSRGRPPKDNFEIDLSTAKIAMISGVLTAGKGYIQSSINDCITRVNTQTEVHLITASICNNTISSATVKKKCFEDKGSTGVKLRKIVTEHAKQLFAQLKPGEHVPIPTAYEVYMVMFRLVTLLDKQMWTGKQSKDGIPLLRYI
jgi:hypothetical protein